LETKLKTVVDFGRSRFQSYQIFHKLETHAALATTNHPHILNQISKLPQLAIPPYF